jgi:hypothetical protein
VRDIRREWEKKGGRKVLSRNEREESFIKKKMFNEVKGC